MRRWAPILFMGALGLAACKETLGVSGGSGPLALAWHTRLTDGGAENLWPGVPGIGDGRVYVQASNQLYALDAGTGKLLWKTKVREAPTPARTVPTATAAAVIVAELGHVLALAPESGRELWRFQPDSLAMVRPAVDQHSVYTGQDGLPVVYALDISSGALRWRTNVGFDFGFKAWVQGLAVTGDTLYAVIRRDLTLGRDPGGMLAALDVRTGRVLWRVQPGGADHAFVFRPVLVGSLIIVSDLIMPGIIAYDRHTGVEVWRHVGNAPVQEPIVSNARLYFGSWQSTAVALDATSGQPLWVSRTKRGSASGSVVCGTRLFVNDGNLQAYELSSGQHVGSMTAADGDFLSGLATDGKLVFVTGADGAYAFRC